MERDLKEKCRLVTGFGDWHIGTVRVSDGPHGVRSQDDGERNNDSIEATCFPTASAAACSWDRELIAEMAECIAGEASELGVSVILGPGVNIKRSPLGGRNFEYYSEDPYLAGALACAFINAMQRHGVGACLKHFAANSQETHRMTSNSMVDDRALHEIYLSAFEAAVKKSAPAAVMGAYNYINGIPACEDRHLLTDILRNGWGFSGLVMSDWGACVDLPACINAGMDVEMPDSRGHHFDDLMSKAEAGLVDIDPAVARIDALSAAYPKQAEEGARSVSGETRSRNHRSAQKIAAESAVLLKNDGFFPLKDCRKILLVGALAEHARIQGGGSSHINTANVDRIRSEFARLGVRTYTVRGYSPVGSRRNPALEAEALEAAAKAKEKNIPILFFGGLTEEAEGEGYDRESFALPENQAALLKRILEVTGDVGFISFGGSPYDMELPGKCRAILQMYLGGEGVMAAAADIVTGNVCPSGKLAESIPYRAEDSGSYGHFGMQGLQSEHPDDVKYAESIFAGYRYYDTFNVPVRYCFGHGLSYTDFEYSDLFVRTEDGACDVSFKVKNTGSVEGAEVSQVYVRNPLCDDFRASRELRGFAKTHLLPGEKKAVSIRLDSRAFSAYSEGEWRVIGGEYEIQVGSSLDDIRLKESLSVSGQALVFPLKLCHVPLSDENFKKIYSHEITDFSHPGRGQYSAKNSLGQLSAKSLPARLWLAFARTAAKLMYPLKSSDDPEVRMMLEGIREGNIDTVCIQSRGLMSRKMMKKIIDSANSADR
ncbi:MAG: glycoside hydrolase family 3 C-terminal domain-containing protein [Lachnospiraceae bacterium]|nr:glycoside hydrolase family 3 C-terminal domain-containing protein [Lachnospiraceae bacterium]